MLVVVVALEVGMVLVEGVLVVVKVVLVLMAPKI